LVLLKVVLKSIPVYGLSLAHVPKSILEKIRRRCFSFLWICKKKEGIPLVSWKILAKPKKGGGWGLKNIHLFGQALTVKSLWRLLFNEGLWGNIMKKKYLKDYIVEQWIKVEPKSIKGASNIWKGLV
jgi:hypothetical protein